MSAKKVLISYSHDSRDHQQRVLVFANQLRMSGVDAIIDQYVTAPPDGWPTWMESQIRTSDFVLLICTRTYLDRVERREQPGKGLGVLWEAKLVYNELYAGTALEQKFVPVVFGLSARI